MGSLEAFFTVSASKGLVRLKYYFELHKFKALLIMLSIFEQVPHRLCSQSFQGAGSLKLIQNIPLSSYH